MKGSNGNGHLVSAVGYARCSTDKQETSIADQQTHVESYAADKGYRIRRWYVDDGISGDATEKRVAFQRMIADAERTSDFDAVLCWDQDRFGRFDLLEAGYWIKPLRDANVALVTVNDGPIDWSEFAGRVTYAVKQEGKHQYLTDLSRNVARGQLEAAKAGSWLGSPPYGYRIEGEKKKKRLVLGDPGHVRIVQRIFRELVEERRSLGNIAERLNAEGVVSPGAAKGIKGRRNCWHYDAVRVIVENPAYCGDYAGGRFSYGKYHRMGSNGAVQKGKLRGPKPKEEWIIRRDNHEPIVARELWERAQAVLAKGKSGHPRKPPETNQYLFASLLRCGKCGCPMWGTDPATKHYECGLFHQSRKGREYKGKDSGCEGTTVREDAVLRSMAAHIDAKFLSLDGKALVAKANRKELRPEDLPKAFERLKRMIAPRQEPELDRRRIEKQAKALDAQLDKARRNLVLLDPENIPTAQQEIKRLQSERQLLEAELRKRPPTEDDVNETTLSVLRSLCWFASICELHADPARRKIIGDDLPTSLLQPWLRDISGIVIHTVKTGSGFGVRHRFERGEIVFREAGANAVRENPHHRGDEPR